MTGLFWLSDAHWAVIEAFMPRNQPGARRVDDRRTISGIVHVIRSGCRCRIARASTVPPRLSTIGSTGGRVGAFGATCWRRWRRLAGLPSARHWTRPTSRRIALRMSVKGGEGAGHRRLARRADDQSSPRHRRCRPAGGHPPHGGQRQRCNSRSSGHCRYPGTPAQAGCRSRLRYRSAAG